MNEPLQMHQYRILHAAQEAAEAFRLFLAGNRETNGPQYVALCLRLTTLQDAQDRSGHARMAFPALTSTDVARCVQCSTRKAHNLMDSGEIPAWKVGKDSRDRRTSVQAVREFLLRDNIPTIWLDAFLTEEAGKLQLQENEVAGKAKVG